ncbi:MAG: TRAP transporter small permease subunit, partial [Deltaproteobacteria bacterium]|nr:TRAP transporter small permease subunit [Deltaproteobacteria bacterium]
MGKRTKGKGKRRKRRAAITRKDLEAKRARREATEDEQAADEDEDDDERDSDAGQDDDEAPDSDRDDEDPVDEDPGDEDPVDEDRADESPADEDPPESEVGSPDGAAWALPLVKLAHYWTWLETRVLFVALLSLTFVLCLFFALRGMKEPLEAEAAAGTIWRAMVGAGVLGGLVRLATRNRGLTEQHRNIATVVAVVVGLATAKLWRGFGIEYFAGVFDWLQEGSTITLMGGLKGISTRLTMTVALIGASLAAAVGGHINIDVVVRLIPLRVRKPVAILGSLATALVCVAASWGLFDHIAVAEYHITADKTGQEKI